jgi:23S rRNA pseudouridine2605 synthase
VEELIQAGRVKVNGRVVTDLATHVTPEDSVKVGSRLLRAETHLTALLYKPRGYLCTASDELDRKTIFDLFPPNWPRVFHVGRLDLESEGLLLVSNDGDLSLALTHPRFKIEKEYEVGLDKPFASEHRDKLLKGFHIPGGRAKAERVEIVGPQFLRVVLLQGLKRQVRLMLYELGYEVTRLCRVRIGPLKISTMKPGEYRLLNAKEVADLKGDRPIPPTRAEQAQAARKRPPRASKL